MNLFKARLCSSFTRIAVGATLALFAVAANAFPIATPGGEGLKVIVGGTGHVMATYQGNSASYSNDLLLDGMLVFNNHATPVGTTVDLGTFAVGSELIFQLFVHDTGYSFYTGPASRNPDAQMHARVQGEWEPGTTLVSFEDLYNGPFDFNDLSFSFTNTTAGTTSVPEPNPFLLMLAGMGLIGLAVRLRTA